MRGQDLSLALQQQVIEAAAQGHSLRITCGNTKNFYGGDCTASHDLSIDGHCGVIDYEPSELVITARAGTPIKAIQELLAVHKQMLAFEPPTFGERASLAGSMACGFSGPRRLFAGAARDFMLGCKIINGRGEILTFGGQVMKNVAGFDVSRLMVGALGTLGVLLEMSIRVLPSPESELTLAYALKPDQALNLMNALPAKPLPLSALAYDGELLRVRLSGAESAVAAGIRQLGGDIDSSGGDFWPALNEQQLPFFQQSGNLWRISVAPATAQLPISGSCLIDWGGALRWLKTTASADEIHTVAGEAGGYATCFSGDNKTDWIRLDRGLSSLQQKVRVAFDPLKLFNPGRLFD